MATLTARVANDEREPLPSSELSRRPSRRRPLGAADGAKRGVRRAWTISSGSSPRWGGPRREVREYSSLPRHRSVADYPSLRACGKACCVPGDHVHTDSGVGTQDEAELAEPSLHAHPGSLDVVKTMLERARQREDALHNVAKAVSTDAACFTPSGGSASRPASRPVSLSLLGLGSSSCAPNKPSIATTTPVRPQGPASSVISTDLFSRRHPSRVKGAFKGPKGRRRRASLGASLGASQSLASSPPAALAPLPRSDSPADCVRTRRRGSDSALPTTPAAAADGGEANRPSLLEGDDFRLVFISSDSSSRDEDEPRSDEDDEDVGDCLSTSSGGAGPTLEDCDWDYFEPSVAAREDSSPMPTPLATPVLRRHRHAYARTFLDGSPSSSDCSSSGWAHGSGHRRGLHGAHLPDWLAGLGDLKCAQARGVHQGPSLAGLAAGEAASGCCLSLSPQPRQPRCLDPASEAGEGTARAATAAGTHTGPGTGQVGPIPIPAAPPVPVQPSAQASAQASAPQSAARSAAPPPQQVACGPGTGACAACGSLVPILVPIPVPVPVLVPVQTPVADDAPADAMRPLFQVPAAPGGHAGRRRKGGGRGRRSKQAGGRAATSSSTSGAAAPAAPTGPGASGDAGRRVSRSSSVAEENDNGVVLVTFRQLMEDVKAAETMNKEENESAKQHGPTNDECDAAQDDVFEEDGDQVPEEVREESDDGTSHEPSEQEEVKSSCASTSSSDEDTNVDFDSDDIDDDDDSDDEEVSRTYRLRDGATLTRELRPDDSGSSTCSSSVVRHHGEDDDEDEDSDTKPFRQVFVVNSSPPPLGADKAASGDRCRARPREAPPPPPVSGDTSRVLGASEPGSVRRRAHRDATDAGPAVATDAPPAPAVPGESEPGPPRPPSPSEPDSAPHALPPEPSALVGPCDGMAAATRTAPAPAATPCTSSDLDAEDDAQADMFGAGEVGADAGVAALNKEVIGQVSPNDLASLGRDLECLSVIESPVALKDIFESLRPEAETQPRSRRGSSSSGGDHDAADGEFSGTESMELSTHGPELEAGDLDPQAERRRQTKQQQQQQQQQESAERVVEAQPAVEGIVRAVMPSERASGASGACAEAEAEAAPGPPPLAALAARAAAGTPSETARSTDGESQQPVARGALNDEAETVAANKYTSLVMISPPESPVSVSVGPPRAPGVTLLHTNLEAFDQSQDQDEAPESGSGEDDDEEDEGAEKVGGPPLPPPRRPRSAEEDVQVVTGANTLSAVICLEEGLADDDSWVEEVEPDRDVDMDMDLEATATDTSSGDEGAEGQAMDREEELRGYHRAAIDFTLHTILEESCEESESEMRPTATKRDASASELEKYFFFELGGGVGGVQQDAMSETNSSIYSEGLESLGTEDGDDVNPDDQADPAELASSRLEKYFLSGFMGFNSRRDSDGSVGSDSEGRPSPEQRRKRLVRARGTGRAPHSSQDNLATPTSPQSDAETTLCEANAEEDVDSEGSSTEGEAGAGHEEPALAVDGQFDTVKRKKRKRSVGSAAAPNTAPQQATSPPLSSAAALAPGPGPGLGSAAASSDEREVCVSPAGHDLAASRTKQHSRDSGFVGSTDDLLNKSASDSSSSSGAATPADPAPPPAKAPSPGPASALGTPLAAGPAVDGPVAPAAEDKLTLEEESAPTAPTPTAGVGASPSGRTNTPPATSLTRRDSFNNWSSDEETNLMMSKMRAFFKNMTGPQHTQQPAPHGQDAPQPAKRKPPQLVYFESELARLMKTVPGIRDDQVRELVEYLSSEDTWSDSYDSSDYTSSDRESAAGQRGSKRALQQQISASCQQIISKFDTTAGAGQAPADQDDAAVVYQRLVASLSKMEMKTPRPAEALAGSHSSPPIFAKVMQHIGGRLVALMHEVAGGQGPQGANQPRERYLHRRLQQKVSITSTTTEEDEDSVTDNESERATAAADGSSGLLARSRSHDLLGAGHGHDLGHDLAGLQDERDEREASDYERFSWRGSFESALMAADSRSRLSCGAESMASVSTAAKRRSAGDLLYSHRSREHLDRVRSCGSIGGIGAERAVTAGASMGSVASPAAASTGPELTLWKARRASVPDAHTSGGSADGDDDDDGDDDLDDEEDHHDVATRSTTLPRSLQATRGAGTNSLPRLPTSSASAATTVLKMNALGQVQSARYRPPGYSRQPSSASSLVAGTSSSLGRAMSAPGLGPHQPPPHPRRERRKHLQQSAQGEFSVAAMRGAELKLRGEDLGLGPDARASPLPLVSSCSASPSPVSARAHRTTRASTLSTSSLSHSLAAAVTSPGLVPARDWLPGEDLLAARLAPATNLGRSDSMASVYSGAGEGRYGTVTVRGEVEFGLQYNYKQNALEIHVVQCRDLAPVDVKRNRSDPYVKVYLLPDKSKGGKRKTRVKKHTLNPFFDETLKFHISLKGLESRTLWLTVWHSDMFGRNDFLGEVMMALENKVFDDPSPRFYPLQERTEPFDDVHSYRGDMIVALKFIPPFVSGDTLGKKGKRSSKGALHVLVKEAKNLTAVKANGTSDPFCKSYLLPDKGRSSKQKTAVIRRSCNPAWNHTFIYLDVSLQELSERSLELTVWDHDRIASNEFLGGMRFNLGTGKHYGKTVDWMDSTGKELTLWQRMLERPNLWVESSVTLRPSLERSSSSSSSAN